MISVASAITCQFVTITPAGSIMNPELCTLTSATDIWPAAFASSPVLVCLTMERFTTAGCKVAMRSAADWILAAAVEADTRMIVAKPANQRLITAYTPMVENAAVTNPSSFVHLPALRPGRSSQAAVGDHRTSLGKAPSVTKQQVEPVPALLVMPP
jgi:hypothetical protein